MYIGRFLVAGKTKNGAPFIAYRVSSTSFPNRIAKINGNTVAIIPKDLNDIFKNPYICYNCIKVVNNTVVASNGSHTDFIAEKLSYGKRDALATVLLAMDYEKDNYKTPRIAGILDREECYLAYIKDDELRVKKVYLKDGKGYYLGVYNSCEINEKQVIEIEGESAEEIAKYLLEYEEFEYPVASAVALIKEKIELAVANK
ncbi:IMP cyclohydrolase [Methanocaldococcus villosus KIN24-T80]|uniref:IMP cyclohydrolase n=1 Tax=Methanocaldococcus villosus KIN24-T80 TaxID=1069083 RepID=N6UUN8_9EURY|nr:IMP cyclohydrolase [Methanocaldococcus villosus]ENN96054.1 IMP cyclohydrolase [Methanocaldococcus villosus KIN24-T80]